MNNIHYSEDIYTLMSLIERVHPTSALIVCDKNTYKHCFPILQKIMPALKSAVMESGEEHKTLKTVEDLWNVMHQLNFDRDSLLINLGGGLITDLGGFAASCYKRGVRFINVPTTLLGMIDAAVGGKVGVNHHGAKNELGTFHYADHVLIYPPFLKTLPEEELKSAMGEAYKYALLVSRTPFAKRIFSTESIDIEDMMWFVDGCLAVKLSYCRADPHDRGRRNVLNFGHTIGHAIEAWMTKNVGKSRHGYCVAWGLVYALWLSARINGYPYSDFLAHRERIKARFGCPPCIMYDWMEPYIHEDKKRSGKDIFFVLLNEEGKPEIKPAWPQIIEEAIKKAFSEE